MIGIASICLWISGLGFGIPCIYGIWHMMQGKGIAYVMGFPAYGDGPFEEIGVRTTVPLLIAFLLVCILECVAGWEVWHAHKGGAILSLTIIPVEMFFFIGFALPYGPPLLILRTVLLIITLGWSIFH